MGRFEKQLCNALKRSLFAYLVLFSLTGLMPDVIRHERNGISPDTAEVLRAKAHQLGEITGPSLGVAQGIMIEPESKLRTGASDPRMIEGRALGY